MATDVAPGVHRLGSKRVSFYLVEEGDRAVVFDAGLPGYWDGFERDLNAIGRSLDDIVAVVLTHAHSDHTGVAGKLHERGVPVHLHPGDHELMRTGKESWEREGKIGAQILRPRTLGFFGHMARNGALKGPKIDDPVAFDDGAVLDLPGRPRIVHTPGHTPGHCIIHLEGPKVVFTGDLICTWHPIIGRLGPQIMPSAFNQSSDQCLASLARLEQLDAEVVLPGHGEPWREGAAAAAARAREAGRS